MVLLVLDRLDAVIATLDKPYLLILLMPISILQARRPLNESLEKNS
jgi:hypothetical protein